MNTCRNHLEKGLTMVEVVIASAIILVAVVALIGVNTLYLKTALSNTNSVKSAYLMEESVEVVRFWRDASWSSNISPLSNGVSYGLVLNGSSWQASTTATSLEGFQRTVTLSPVYRDSAGDIVTSSGTLDTNTKLVTAQVSWPANGTTTTKTLQTYITNLWQN